MLDIILQILSILGIILLVVLLVAVILLLLVLFFPITYRLYGTKSEKEIFFSAKAKWLFGILRVNYSYPEPGKIVAKLLWFKIFDSSEKTAEETKEAGQEDVPKDKKAVSKTKTKAAVKAAKSNTKEDRKAATKTETKIGESDTKVTAEADEQEAANGVANEVAKEASVENTPLKPQEPPDQGIKEENVTEEPKNGIIEKFLQKIEKIKYTFRNICDKIKMIWENISYYSELLQEENTRELFSHACLRIGKILKSIRPRHLEARILAGTGSPDTTGYLYGVYGMLLPTLGSKFLVTPDFERAVLEGDVKASGHITVAVLLVNGLKLLLDKKLHLSLKKLKNAPGRDANSEKIKT